MARLSKRKRCAKINGKAGGRPRKIIAVETTLPVDDSDGNAHNVMEECVDVDDEDLTIAEMSAIEEDKIEEEEIEEEAIIVDDSVDDCETIWRNASASLTAIESWNCHSRWRPAGCNSHVPRYGTGRSTYFSKRSRKRNLKRLRKCCTQLRIGCNI